MKYFKWLLLGLISLCLMVTWGCVSKSDYENLQAELERAKLDLASLQADYDDLKADWDTLRDKDDALATRTEQLQLNYESLKADYNKLRVNCEATEKNLTQITKELYPDYLNSNARNAQFVITTNSDTHADYGLCYPITYRFHIPTDANNLTAWQIKDLTDSWSQLPTRTGEDFFNGIDAVRFDYSNDFAYVSTAFGSNGHDVFLLFKNSNGDLVSGITYDSITPYYDNRKAVVTATTDDFGTTFSKFNASAADAFSSRSIWLSAGLRSTHSADYDWESTQSKVDDGYFEPVAHSRTHPHISYEDYDSEIGGCRDDIKNNLTLPALNRKGDDEYIYAWLEPYGESDGTAHSKLGSYKYLVDRDIAEDDGWATWDDSNGLYHRVGYSIRMGSDGIENLYMLNNKFDSVYKAGGIYHLMFHPTQVNWEADQYALNHLDHIKAKKDVWYVAFGHLYLYHYVQERGKSKVIKLG